MSGNLQPALADLLAYLGEMGYSDLYLDPSRAAAPPVPAASPGVSRVAEPVPTPIVTPPPVPAVENAELAVLAATVAACTRCRLAEGRTKVVFGSGNPAAELMFVGEGPGADEDRQGLPFVGAAGELLTRIIQAIEMTRDEVYIANVVKCRPPGNRDPQPDEVAACRGFLERQIDLIRPKVIVALGRIAAQALLGNESPIGQMRGQWYRIRGVPAMVTYHPAALLRNQGLKRPTWEDMQQVRDRLRELRA